MKNISFTQHHFRRGASLMIALIIFLLCALAGASAFIMSASNAGRYSHTDEQKYYSVSSAALMLVDMADDLTYTSQTIEFKYEREWTFSTADPSNQHPLTDGYTLTLQPTEGKPSAMSGATTLRETSKLNFAKAVKEQCDKLVPFLNVPKEWYDRVETPKKAEKVDSISYRFTISVKDSQKFGTVTCKMVMNANYDLILTFNGGDSEYAITVYWVADIKEEKSTKPAEYKYTEAGTGGYTTGHMTQVDTLKVTVTWSKENVTISRGEAITDEVSHG